MALSKLKVLMPLVGQEVVVGQLYLGKDRIIYFQYEASFLEHGLAISPFKLKQDLTPQTTPQPQLFEGLFGVFADSLPDSWGMLLMSRSMRQAGVDYECSTALDRLAFVGRNGFGSLIYEPSFGGTAQAHADDSMVKLARLAKDSIAILNGLATEVLPELLIYGGSPGGARPKVAVGICRQKEKSGKADSFQMVYGSEILPQDYEPWLIKFTSRDEDQDASIMEYLYAKTAQHVGLCVPEVLLVPGDDGRLWFACKRFDRNHNDRFHTHTLAGLLHADFRLPSTDYSTVVQATSVLTRTQSDIEQIFRLAVFNVFFHNRDDHAKNFSFVMAKDGSWRLAPAYDLTFSYGPGGEHATAICGEGRAPSREHLFALAKKANISNSQATKIIEQVKSGASFLTKQMKDYGVAKNHPTWKFIAKGDG